MSQHGDMSPKMQNNMAQREQKAQRYYKEATIRQAFADKALKTIYNEAKPKQLTTKQGPNQAKEKLTYKRNMCTVFVQSINLWC